ncbi:hypothetical protein G9A89_010378 [Geosiphon pyriformis]|nr:hypothetical protein G9A89_010378 [Geosiphon pyriformis]
MELAISLISPLLEVQLLPGNVNSQQTDINNIQEKRPKISTTTKFKVAITPDATTLEYYQSIYTHCKQRFNISDGIEVVKKSVYQYIENCINNYLFGNYNISEVRSNLYNNLAHYSQLRTEDLNSKTLATYFHELNFNIIKYCEKTYPVQFQYSIDFESETETSNKGKNKLKQDSKTTPNTPTLPKTTAKHLQTPEQGTKDFTSLRSPIRQQEPLQTSSNLLDFLAENQSEHSQTAANKENKPEISEEESIDSENKKDKMTTYIAKISEFNGEDIETRTAGEWFKNLATPFNDWNAFKAAFLKQFTDNNTSITLCNCFQNIKQELSESVMTYIRKFNKLLRQIHQLETNDYYSNAQILDQFIAGLKDKLIKKVRPHVPKDLNSAIQHAKRYEMAIEEANPTKLVNLAIRETSSAAEEKIDQLTKKNCYYCEISGHWKRDCRKLQQDQQNRSNQCYPSPKQSYYQPPLPVYYPPRPQYQNNYYQPAAQPIQQQYQQPLTQHYQVPARRLITQNQFTSQNWYQVNNNRISLNNQLVPQNSIQPRPNYYHTQPTRIAENANLSDIFSFEFEANESPFLLSNAATNEQKAITAMYTEAEVEGKTICLILNSGSTRTQTVIVTADDMKKTPIGEIDNFPFTFDGIIILVKVLVMDALQYQALIKNNWLQKANANLNWETQKLTISYQGQHVWVPATCGTFNKYSEKAPAFEFEPEEEKSFIETFMALGLTSNWADEMEQEHFTPHSELKTSEWNIPYSKPEPRKQHFYIPLKCKDCHKKLSSMEACISPEEEYENHTCYYSMRGEVCDQTCQYALLISEKVKRGTPFNVAYNSALNKLYHYSHNAEMIFDLAITLINGATKENVCQMKKAEYIEYTIELAGFNYKDEVEVYHQIASHTYSTQETQQLEQMNIKLCEECIMPCDEHENNENEIEFGEPKAMEEIETTPIYLIENQPALQLKYFNNNGVTDYSEGVVSKGFDGSEGFG